MILSPTDMGNSSQMTGFSISILISSLQYLNWQNLDSNYSDKAFRIINVIKLIQSSDLSLLTQLTVSLTFTRFTLYIHSELNSDYVVLLRCGYYSPAITLLTVHHPLTPFSASSLPLISVFSFSVSICSPYLTKVAYTELCKHNTYTYICIMYAKTYLSTHKKPENRERREES